MSGLKNTNWHVLVDRFIWYDDLKALSLISEKVTDKEIKEYIFVFYNDDISLEEIKNWRSKNMQDSNYFKTES